VLCSSEESFLVKECSGEVVLTLQGWFNLTVL